MLSAVANVSKWPSDDGSIAHLVQLHRQLGAISKVGSYLIYQDPNYGRYLRAVVGAQSNNFVAQLSVSNSVAGFCHLKKHDAAPDVAFVNNILVEEAYAGRGYGSKILRESILATGWDPRWIELDAFTSNPKAVGWYQRLGFVEVRTRYWARLSPPQRKYSSGDIRFHVDDNGFTQIFHGELLIGTRIRRVAVLNSIELASEIGSADVEEAVVCSPERVVDRGAVALETSLRLRAHAEEVLERLEG